MRNRADIEPFRKEDDAYNLGLVRDWAPETGVRKMLLAGNPARSSDSRARNRDFQILASLRYQSDQPYAPS